MANQVFHKITSMLMAFVVLFSTMSFTIDMHYCGDTLVDTSVFGKAHSCGMEMKKTDSTSDRSIAKKNCCDQHYQRQKKVLLSWLVSNLTIDRRPETNDSSIGSVK